ncbi:hypothetical protein FB451DRAFT_1468632 [Mycena latifolia]|nr:hypothetical protein FB451DRAFT_1468632 [Mycena latifolia]
MKKSFGESAARHPWADSRRGQSFAVAEAKQRGRGDRELESTCDDGGRKGRSACHGVTLDAHRLNQARCIEGGGEVSSRLVRNAEASSTSGGRQKTRDFTRGSCTVLATGVRVSTRDARHWLAPRVVSHTYCTFVDASLLSLRRSTEQSAAGVQYKAHNAGPGLLQMVQNQSHKQKRSPSLELDDRRRSQLTCMSIADSVASCSLIPDWGDFNDSVAPRRSAAGEFECEKLPSFDPIPAPAGPPGKTSWDLVTLPSKDLLVHATTGSHRRRSNKQEGRRHHSRGNDAGGKP